ncbi:MAG: sigma-54-dependent Fis family transcriptional regulator [Pseudomonadota bacterium]
MDNARMLLAKNGVLPSHLFNQEIRASWQRCFDLGLDPYDKPKFPMVSESDLAELRGQNELVRRLVLIEMQNLHHQIAGSNFIIIFSNTDGIILDSISEEVDKSNPAASRIAPGNIWSEDVKGTNALGLVISSWQPSIVHGDEHYFVNNSDLTCAAAPIFNPDGKIEGIIDATSDCRSRQRHTLALVKMSCLTIENSLFRNRYWDKLIIEFHNRHEFLGTLQSGMLAFERDGILVQKNRLAKFLLQGIPLHSKVHFNEVFSTPFGKVLSNLHKSLLINLADVKGSSFAVKALNFFPSKFYNIPAVHSPSRKAAKLLCMVHDDPAMEAVVNMVERAVHLNAPILIQGETGTGKELLAHYAHITSDRKGDFVAVNCASLQETLIESELFGYTDGAFTGATRGGSIGLVQQADEGTLFLDEIGVMPIQLQAKLLRFLDRCQIRPVGATADIQLDIQLISASNSDLSKAVQLGNFRADLLYRINSIEVVLPPLRERTDFHLIVNAILETFDNPPQIEREALKLLEDYHWPGNIRELKSFLIRLLVSAGKETICAKDVQLLLRNLPSKKTEKRQRNNLADQEMGIVLAAYARHKGNISAVARELGISRNKVYNKLKEARS